MINININIARKLLIFIALASTLGYLGIILNFLLLKFISVLAQFSSLFVSINIIKRDRKYINWKITFIILSIFSFFPLIRIVFDSFAPFTQKSITDGIIVYGAYYQLPIVGLALVLLLKNSGGYELLKNYAYFVFPFGLVLLILIIYYSSKIDVVGLGHIAITNCFLPVSLLTFYPFKKKNIFFGWAALFALVVTASMVFSRSYIIVASLIAGSAIYMIFKSKKINSFLIMGILILIYFLLLAPILEKPTGQRNETTIDKFQFESLEKSISNFIRTGDFDYIFFWEGNSRAIILLDAFSNFTQFEWLYGRGIFGKYQSFVERSTIEIGFAQEVFRFGLIYLILSLFYFYRGYRTLKKKKDYQQPQIYFLLSTLIIIRFTDSLIYGVPEISVYSLIFFWAIMQQSLNYNLIRNYHEKSISSSIP